MANTIGQDHSEALNVLDFMLNLAPDKQRDFGQFVRGVRYGIGFSSDEKQTARSAAWQDSRIACKEVSKP